jgi:hypothetical protein
MVMHTFRVRTRNGVAHHADAWHGRDAVADLCRRGTLVSGEVRVVEIVRRHRDRPVCPGTGRVVIPETWIRPVVTCEACSRRVAVNSRGEVWRHHGRR